MAEIAMVGMMLGGGVLGAIGNLREANAAADAALHNAKLADENASIVRQQAADEEYQERYKSKKELGSIRAAYGKSGVTMDGSPTAFLEDSRAVAERNALSIRHAGARQAMAYEREAKLLRQQAGDMRTTGIINAIAGGVKTGTSIMKRVG